MLITSLPDSDTDSLSSVSSSSSISIDYSQTVTLPFSLDSIPHFGDVAPGDYQNFKSLSIPAETSCSVGEENLIKKVNLKIDELVNIIQEIQTMKDISSANLETSARSGPRAYPRQLIEKSQSVLDTAARLTRKGVDLNLNDAKIR